MVKPRKAGISRAGGEITVERDATSSNRSWSLARERSTRVFFVVGCVYGSGVTRPRIPSSTSFRIR